MSGKIRLTESQLTNLIKESVKRIINEIGDTTKGQYALGSLAGRQQRRMLDAIERKDEPEFQKHRLALAATKKDQKILNNKGPVGMPSDDLAKKKAFAAGEADYRKRYKELNPRKKSPMNDDFLGK